MLMKKDFLNKLKDFGLNSYEASIWTALLSRGVSTAGELSDIANVPRSRSYDVLESLEKKGFIMMKVGKPIKYLAVHPEEVVERVKKRIREDAEKHVDIVDSIKDSEVLEELQLLHSKGIDLVDPTDLTGSVKGHEAVISQIDSLLKAAKRNITIVSSVSGSRRKLEALEKSYRKAKSRGVELRFGITGSYDDVLARKLGEFGVVKSLDGVSGRFVVVDDEQLFFMLSDDAKVHPNYDTGVWVQTKHFAGAVRQLLDKAW
ncbi:MAG: TrmB family transcriptional regulator [Nitrosarchaeum sp.]|nr:TrmB family transcriptional regulator [Nitrosarchaeum sp.]